MIYGVLAAVLQRRDATRLVQPVLRRGWTSQPWHRSARLVGPLVDLYRIPLLRVAEVLAPLALLIAVVLTLLPGGAPPLGFAARVYDSPWPVLTTVCLSALYLLLAWGYRSVERTWAGSMILMFGLLHTLRLNYVGLVEQPELVALLAHSTLAVIAGVLLDVWTRRRADEQFSGEIRRVFGKPLGDSALLSSVLVLPVLGLISWASLWSLAGCLLWLTAIWLIVAWRHRDARLFAAHQAMLMLAALVATTAWLEGRPGGFDLQRDLSEAGVLQTYGISLGLLVLVWAVARILLCGDRLALEGGPLSCDDMPSPPAPLPQAGEGS